MFCIAFEHLNCLLVLLAGRTSLHIIKIRIILCKKTEHFLQLTFDKFNYYLKL